MEEPCEAWDEEPMDEDQQLGARSRASCGTTTPRRYLKVDPPAGRRGCAGAGGESHGSGQGWTRSVLFLHSHSLRQTCCSVPLPPPSRAGSIPGPEEPKR